MEVLIGAVCGIVAIAAAIFVWYILVNLLLGRTTGPHTYAAAPLPYSEPMPLDRAKRILADLPVGWTLTEKGDIIDPNGQRRAWAYDGDLPFLARYAEQYRRRAGMEPR